MMITKEEIIKKLDLIAHPEGGFYRENYRSKGSLSSSEFVGERNYCTSIYFLLTSDNFSGFHRIKQDEIWNYYSGSNLFVHVIDENGIYKRHEIGLDLNNNIFPQLVVPANCWFASSVKDSDSFSLVGCSVSPGFDFSDFELAERANLCKEYPQNKKIITQLTRL